MLDPVIPGLQVVADERAPAVVAPWDQYVRTRRYAAVVQRLKGLTRAGKTATPGRTPIGFLPGDDVTPQDEMMAMMAPGEGCDTCPERCTPNFVRWRSGTVRYDTQWLSVYVKPYFTAAMNTWSSAFGSKLRFEDVGGGTIKVSEAIEDTGPWGGYLADKIWIYPKTIALNSGEAREGVFLHEIGHSLGLSPVYLSGCESGTVMWDTWNGNVSTLLLHLTTADLCVVSAY